MSKQRDINLVVLTGALGKDPELKYTQSGKALARVSLAVNSGFGDNQRTNWIDIVAWEKTAEFLNNHFKKGSKIMIEGEISVRPYEADNKTRYSFEVIAREIYFRDSKPQTEQTAKTTSVGAADEITDDDVPF